MEAYSLFRKSHLFKYVRSASAVEKMLEGWLRFSMVDELNDPCELVDEINKARVSDSLQWLRSNGYSEVEYDWLCRQGALLQALSPENQVIPVPTSKEEAHRQTLSAFYDDIERMAVLQRDAVRNIKKKAGVLSLTTSWNSLPMWAHYADNAKGFVVVFDRLTTCFPGDCTGVLDEVAKVDYSNDFEGVTFRPSSQRNLFFWKLQDWSYEQEWRVVSSLANCESHSLEQKQMWLRKIDPEFVSGAIIGWKTDAQTRTRLQKIQAESKRDFKLYQASVTGLSVTISELNTPELQ